MSEPTNTRAHEHTNQEHTVQRAWTWLVLWIGVIVLESFAGSSENTGRILWPLLHWFWPGMPFLTYFQIHFWIRKLGHLTGFGILGLISYRAWWTTLGARRHAANLSWRVMLRNLWLRAAALSMLVVLAVASLDEWHQGLEPGRGSSWHDVLLDCMGAMLALDVLLNYAEWRRWIRQRAARPASASAGEPAAESPQ